MPREIDSESFVMLRRSKGWTNVVEWDFAIELISRQARHANRYRRFLPRALALAQRAFAIAESRARAARPNFLLFFGPR